MANDQYAKQNLVFGFCPTAIIPAGLPRESSSTDVVMSGFNASFADPIRIGMAAMINDEIVIVIARSGNNLSLARGAADTIPQAHAPNSRIWFFEDSIGRAPTQYGATESVSVKPLPRTLSGGFVPVASSPPLGVVMNSRFARPYPPGNLRVNGQPWWQVSSTTISSGSALSISWAHRNRITQADLLVQHTAASITPEVGTTYRLQMYRASDDSLRASYTTEGDSFVYTAGQAANDLGGPGSVVEMYALIHAVRDGLTSRHAYQVNFSVNPAVNVQNSAAFSYGFESRPINTFSGNYTIS